MKYLFKYILIIILLIEFSNCTGNKGNVKLDIIKKYSYSYNFEGIHEEISHKFSNIILYVSSENSKGDIWLYNISNNSKWQITYLNNPDIRIKFISKDYSLIVFNDGSDNIIDITHNDVFRKIYIDYNKEIYLLNLRYIQEKESNVLYAVATPSTNNTLVDIYKIYYNSQIEEWCAKLINWERRVSFIIKDTNVIYNMIISPLRNKLAFISYDPENELYLYTLNLKNNKLTKIIKLNSISDIIWNEDNNSLLYYEGESIFKVDNKGLNKLILTEVYPIVKLIQMEGEYFKFFYITNFQNFYFFYLKNMDLIGKGKFLFNSLNVRNVRVSADGKSIFFDTLNNELYIFNLKDSSLSKLFENSSLASLN